jgi:two-component system OmpR family response regulator
MKALVVEDDRDLADQIAAALAEAGFVVDRANDGAQGEYLGATASYAAAVLDIGLPEMDGVAVLRRWREAGIAMPVLVLTARDSWADKVRGFRAGADDYVLKPFRMEEVVMRLQTLVRRAAGHASAEVAAGALALDSATGAVTLAGLPVRLTAFEARLLRWLLLHKGRVVTRTALSEQMYDGDGDRDFRSLEVVIGRIRRKIGEGRIETVRGEGYRLMPQDPP